MKTLIMSIMIAILYAGCGNTCKGVLVTVNNKTGQSIKNVTAIYTGGSYVIPELKPNDSDSRYVNPSTDSHIDLEFEDSKKKIVKVRVDNYFGRNYGGSIDVFIKKNHLVTFTDNTTIP